MQPDATPNLIVNIHVAQSLAVQSRVHVPVVFDDPERFKRKGSFQELRQLDAAYATLTKGWRGYADTARVLKGKFEPFAVFG